MTETPPDAGQLFRAGQLTAAIEAANAAVRRAPTDFGARFLLAELLLFAGNLERAEVILDAAADMEPGAAVTIAEFRQLLRGETARRQLHREGRVPEFLDGPTPAMTETLAAIVALRDGDLAEAARRAEAAEAVRPRAPGLAGDTPFDDFRDADDLCAGFFEVLTTTGKYFWIPTERVERVEFHPAKRPRDLCWRRASMSVAAGPDGDVYLPTTYWSADPALAEELRLGRATDWPDPKGGPARGLGQRVFLAGDEALEINALDVLSFGA
jgi:type VI secretion system protein ImpE